MWGVAGENIKPCKILTLVIGPKGCQIIEQNLF